MAERYTHGSSDRNLHRPSVVGGRGAVIYEGSLGEEDGGEEQEEYELDFEDEGGPTPTGSQGGSGYYGGEFVRQRDQYDSKHGDSKHGGGVARSGGGLYGRK